MAPKRALPANASPDTSLYPCPETGEFFDSPDALFECLVSLRLPAPSAHKAKEKVFTVEPVVWHERSLKQIDLDAYRASTKLDFHVELAALFLVPLTPMRSLHALVDTILVYMQSRFFREEKLMVSTGGTWHPSKITAVTVDEVAHSHGLLDGTMYPPCHFRYDVTLLSETDTAPAGTVLHDIRCDELRRPQGTYARTQLRASILQHCKCREPRKSDSIWSLKRKTLLYYDLNRLSWWDLFAGPEPRFNSAPRNSKNFPRRNIPDSDTMPQDKLSRHKKHRSSSGPLRKDLSSSAKMTGSKRKRDDGHGSHDDPKRKKHKHGSLADGKGRERPALSSAERAERKKVKQQEYKKKWRENLKQKRVQLSSVWAQVFSVGEDLECPNLKPLPVVPRLLDTVLPEKFIADGLFVLEFLRVFGPGLDRACEFADIAGWDLDRLYGALASRTVDGEYTRLLGFACRAIMASIPKRSPESDAPPRMFTNVWQQQGAEVVSTTLQRTGTAFHNLPVTGAGISEVVRLCLLAACVPVRVASSSESKYDNGTLRLLKSQEGAALYRLLLLQSVFSLSFVQRLELLVRLFQAVIEADKVREMLDQANASVEEHEKALKGLKSLSDEVSKLKGKIVVSKDKEPDKPSEKNDRFRQLLDTYARKRNGLRSDRDKTAREIADDIRLLNEGRKHRKLTDVDVIALHEAMDDIHAKFVAQLRDERSNLTDELQADHQSYRLQPIGLDRHSFRYWDIPCMQGLLIECTPDLPAVVCAAGCLCGTVFAGRQHQEEASSSWWRVDKDEDIALLSKSLLVNGEREVALKREMDQHIQSFRARAADNQAQHLMTTTPVAPSERSLPELGPSEFFDAQLSAKLEEALLSVNSKLQTCRLGGIPAEDQEAWLRGVLTTNLSASDDVLSGAPSPEISAPSLVEEKPSVGSVQEATAMDLEPMDVEESAMEPIQATDRRSFDTSKKSFEPVDTAVWDAAVMDSGREDGDADEDPGSDSESGTHDQVSTGDSGKKSNEAAEQPQLSIQKSADVKKFINCMIRLVDAVQIRYLGAPLVTIDEDYVKDVSKLTSWRNSLMASHTLSQLSIHFSVFEKCILWDKSTSNAVCKACRKRGDALTIAACDRCDKRFHLDCVIPPLHAVPEDAWVCPYCLPTRLPRQDRRARQAVVHYYDDSSPAAPETRRQRTENAAPKLSSRTARAMQRTENGGYHEEFAADEEEREKSAGGDTRRSGRRAKRVDYKGLDEGTSQDEDDVATQENGLEEDVDDDAAYEKEMNADDYETVSSVESEESEYDPTDGERPPRGWGKAKKA